MKETGGMAFPNCAGNQIFAPGMTLRDYFAGQALAGVLAESSTINPNGNEQKIAEAVFKLADAMIAERDKEE